jgi:Secretion system C-terminal sorting domain/Fibronectin type III domain
MNFIHKKNPFASAWLIFICFISISIETISQSSNWKQLGQGGGGQIMSLYSDPVNPENLYVGSDVAGVWKSTNGGDSYKYITGAWKCEYTQAIVKHPTSNKLFIGSSTGLFFTQNDGSSWSQMLSLPYISNIDIYQIGNNDVIYVTTGKTRIGENGEELLGDNKVWRYNYQNNGIWQSYKISVPTTANTYSISVNPSNTSEIWVTTNNGVFISSNGGSTWTNKSTNLPSGAITSMISNPSNYGEKIVTNYNAGIYKRNPTTGNWTNISSNIDNYDRYAAVKISPTATGAWGQKVFVARADGHLSKGVWYSTNGGSSWEVAGYMEVEEMGWNSGSKISCNPKSICFNNNGHLFMGKAGNIFKSTNPQDASLSVWSQIYTTEIGSSYKNNGLVNTVARDIVADPLNPNEMWISEGDRLLWKSNDAGETFNRVENFNLTEEINLQHGYFVVFHPTNPEIMLTGLAEASPGSSIKSALFKSINGGESWTQIYSWAGSEMIRLAYNKTGTEIFIGLKGSTTGVYKSNTGGASWQYLAWGANNVYEINTHPTDNNIIFVGIGDLGPPTRGLHRGVRNGGNWEFTRVLNGGLNWDVKFDPFNSSILYAAMGLNGVYKSEDNGLNWVQILTSNGGTGCRALAVDKITGNLYAASDGEEIGELNGGNRAYLKKSSDRGNTWEDITEDFPNVPIWSMNFINGNDNPSLIVNTKGLGCWMYSVVSCSNISGLVANEISETSAKLNWIETAGVETYIINYKKTSDTNWTEVNISDGFATTTTINSLMAGTTYDWRIKSSCSSSVFGVINQFTTLAAQSCLTPQGLSTNQITTTSAKANWLALPQYNGYTVRFRKIGATVWTEKIISSPTTSSVSGFAFSPNTTYQWCIKVNCTESSSYSSVIEFTTLAGTGIAEQDNTVEQLELRAKKETNNKKPSISPNPTSNGFFNVLINSVDAESTKRSTIEIFDLTGKLIQSEQSSNKVQEISTENMPKGIYFIKINVEGISHTEKLLVN